MELTFINEYDEAYDEYEEIFSALFLKTLDSLNINGNYLLEVNLIDDLKIHKINKDYRHIDRPTDVISFAFNDEVEGEVKIIDDIPKLLGEIFISIDRALAQAKEYGHSARREISFLFVHGLLHLLGYDHQNKEQEEEMFTLQEEILK